MSVTKEELEKYNAAYMRGEPLISDEEYDKLQEEYVKEHGENSRLYTRSAQTKTVADLVGTLPKVYGVTQTMRPEQKSYDDWVKTNKLDPDMKIVVQPKFDGCSIAYDAKEHRYFKRGDYDNGESEEVTNIFEKMHFWNKEFVDNTCDGSKFEMMMGVDIHQKYFKEYETPRDAAVAYIRKAQKNPSFDPFDVNRTLVLVPLRDMINGKQYIPSYLENISLKTTVGDYDSIQRFINELLSNGAALDLDLGACQMGNLEYIDTYKCDGVVISVLDEDDSIVKEIAIKIIHDVHEAKLIDIEYQLGNTGKITPVAKITPTLFADGKRTVTSITLSTLDRVKKMNLRHNDTVHVMYNIVPYFIDSKHDGDYPFNIPHKCPICGADLDMSHLETVRCMNPECVGRKIGDITRYCISMRMLGISEATITKLFEAGKVTCISDLYTLTKEDIMSIDGYREKSADNIIRIIWQASQDCPISRWLGALPFKDISSKKWDTLLNIFIGNDELLKSNKMRDYIENESSDFLSDIMSTYFVGIGPLTLAAINEGWMRNIDEMRRIIKNISFRVTTVSSNKPITTYVTFTGCRDTELVEWLNKKGIGVIDFSSKTQYLIIPNKEYQNKKTNIAKSKGLYILTIDEVKSFFEPF